MIYDVVSHADTAVVTTISNRDPLGASLIHLGDGSYDLRKAGTETTIGEVIIVGEKLTLRLTPRPEIDEDAGD